MSKNEKSICFGALVEQLKKIELTTETLQSKIKEIHDSVSVDAESEICPDEVESEIALLNVLKDICIEQMLDTEPEGDS